MTWKAFGGRFRRLVAGLRKAVDQLQPNTNETAKNQAEIDTLVGCVTSFTDPIPPCLYDLEGETLTREEYDNAVRVMEREFWAAMSDHAWQRPIPTVGEAARRERAALMKPEASGR